MNSELDVDEFIEFACSIDCGLSDRDRLTNLEKAKSLLAEHPELGSANIFSAAAFGKLIVVSDLLNQNPSLAKQSGGPRNWTALLYLCFSRFFRDEKETVKESLRLSAGELLKAGADPNAFFMLGEDRETCLYGACGVVNDAPLAALLLEHGANVNDEEATYHVAEFSKHDCIKVLLDHGLDADRSATVLLRKLDFEDLEGVKRILNWGVDVNHQGVWGKSALHQAIMRGRSDAMIQILLEHGADPSATRQDGKSAYQLACQFERDSIAQQLVERGAPRQ